MKYKNVHPFYKVLDEKIEKLEEINKAEDYAKVENFSLEKYLLMILGSPFPFYRRALKNAISNSKTKIEHEKSLINPINKNNKFKYFLKNFKITDTKEIEKFLVSFIKDLKEFYFFNLEMPMYIEKVEFKDGRFLFVYEDNKRALSLKINSLDIFLRMSAIYIETKYTGLEHQNVVKNEKNLIYIENGRIITEVEKEDVFGVIMPQYNLLDSFYNNIKIEERKEGFRETKKWLLNSDFLVERLVNSCGGHGHDDFLEKHPVKIVDNIKKYENWGTLSFCKYNKCKDHKCCYHKDEVSYKCKKPAEKFFMETEKTLKNSVKRIISYIDDQFLFNVLPESSQIIMKENISFIQRNKIVEQREERNKKQKDKGVEEVEKNISN